METTGTRRYPGEVVYAYNTGNWEAERERRGGEEPKIHNKLETSLSYMKSLSKQTEKCPLQTAYPLLTCHYRVASEQENSEV